MTDEATPAVQAPPTLEQLMAMPVDLLLNTHVTIKAGLEKLAAEFALKEGARKERLKMIEIALLEKAKAEGASQFKVEGVATAFKQEKTSYACADWNVLGAFIFDQAKIAEAQGRDPLQYITQFTEKRLSKTGIEEFRNSEFNKDKTPPPAVNMSTEVTMVVRRATKK